MKTWLKLVLLFLLLATIVGVVHYQYVVSQPSRRFGVASNFHPSNFQNLRFAHRGGYAFGPENALETIVGNIRNRNINALEVDVHMTADKELVLFHDEHVNRILETDLNKVFSEFTFEELKRIPLRDRRLGTVYVPRLEDLVDTLKHLIQNEEKNFIIELDFKAHGELKEVATRELIRIIEEQEKLLGESIFEYFFVSTFYPEVLAEIRKHSNKVVVALGVHSDSPSSKWGARAVIALSHYLIKKYDVSIIEPNHCMVTDRFVNKWSEREILINTYTVNTSCEKEYMKNFAVAFTTNCPGDACDHDASEQLTKMKNWCSSCY